MKMKISRLSEVIKMEFVLKEKLEELLGLGKGFVGLVWPFRKYALVTDTTASRLKKAEAEKRQEHYRQIGLLYGNRVRPYNTI